jgi:hypothetical protein
MKTISASRTLRIGCATSPPCAPYGPLGSLGRPLVEGWNSILATQSTLASTSARWSRSGWGGALRGLFAPKPSAIASRSEAPQGPDRPWHPQRPQGVLAEAPRGFPWRHLRTGGGKPGWSPRPPETLIDLPDPRPLREPDGSNTRPWVRRPYVSRHSDGMPIV